MKKWLNLVLMGVAILALDIASKAITHVYFPFGGVSIFKSFLGIDFYIHYVTNKGIAWGMGGHLQNFIIVARTAIIGGLITYLARSPKAYAQRIPLMLIIAGGLGNIIDYFIYGHVVDMFHFILWGYSFPVFNVADASIFFGILTLLLKGLKRNALQARN